MKTDRLQTILVVDDEPPVLESVADYLEDRGWGQRVFKAANGREGLSVFHSRQPDLILVDLFMPEMNGFELLARVREKSPDLPVIVISGQGERAEVIDALRMGAWDYLCKPIEKMSHLGLAIDRALEKAKLLNENRMYREQLEGLIAQKTAELIQQQETLLAQTQKLEKANMALNNLLHQREIETTATEEAMVANLKRFVFSYLDELETLSLDRRVSSYLGVIRTNIEHLIAPISRRLGCAYQDLTATEIKVADLIRQGQSTKAIATILNTSTSTVEKHRNNIRRKLKLLNKNVNLYTYLNTVS